MPVVTFGVLGPLSAANEHGPIDLKGRRHRAVLARLLLARGRVVPVRWLIDDLWDDAPAGALGSLQTFVGALRKALEPDRPPRAPAQLLISAPPGYALRADPEAVDAWRFEAAVTRSAELLAEGQAEPARLLLDDVLGTWRGPAFAEFADHDWARGEATRLEDLRRLAVSRRAEARLSVGRAAEAVPDLELQVAAEPLGEDGWRLLALALYLTGRQGDALAALRRARELLRTELGVDPGPRLRQLEADVLAQAPHLHAGSNRPATGRTTPQVPTAGRPAEPAFVGRVAELADLETASVTTAAAGRPGLALVSGAAGAGKTALARALAERLAATGWITAWGTSPEQPGTPSAWPWTQIRESLSATEPGLALAPAGDPGRTGQDSAAPDPMAARFHRHRAIGSALARLSAAHPVLLVFDDLHWADEETLALLTTLATDPDAGPVLVVATFRSTEISAELAEALARVARAEPTRVYLGGLTESQVRELVHALTDRSLSPGEAHTIHARSGGNPFFVKELTRLWESDPATVEHAVPAGVRDVIRHRLARLPEKAHTPLQQAAVLGRQVDLDVLIQLAGDEHGVLDSVESALRAGFLVEIESDQLAFAHALVHETLYDDIVAARRSRWHATAAEIIETSRPDDVAAIAHHLLRAGTRTTAARAAHYAAAAAERAERRSAPHEAARLWRETVAALDRSDPVDARRRLTAVMGLVRALAVTGDLPAARRHREQAVGAAEALGDPVLTAGVIGSFDVPAIWTANDDPALSEHLVAAAERTLAGLPVDRRRERARLLATIAMERRADAGRRGSEAAREAEAISRDLDDPTLLAFALNGRFMQTFERAGLAPERAAIGAELLDLAGGQPGLVTFEVLGHLILLQAHSALADLGTADRHATAADRLAERHELPLVGVFTDWYAALRLALTGDPAQARTAYRAAAARLTGTGMSGVQDGILPLALLCLDAAGPTGEPGLPAAVPADAVWGPYQPWARPLVLLARGEREQAAQAARRIPRSPQDLLFEARTCLHAMIAIQVADRPTMQQLYTRLLPAAGELAGAGSGLLSLGPVALHLGRLCTALGRPDQAAEHYRQGRQLAAKVLRSPPDRAVAR